MEKSCKIWQNPPKPFDLCGKFLELLGGFEPPTSSLPTRPKNFFRAFCLFSVISALFHYSLVLFERTASECSEPVLWLVMWSSLTRRKGNIKPLHNRRSGLRIHTKTARPLIKLAC